MIRTVNKTVNKMNKRIGLPIQIPLPSKEMLEVNQCINGAVTSACILSSVIFSSKVMLGLGVLSATGIIITQVEKKTLGY